MKILVVGAGPVGLTAALELARLGDDVTIIDKNSTHSQVSKAIGINPRSLDLLESSGVTKTLLDSGLKIQQFFIHCDHHEKKLDISRIHHRFNFMIFLPQDQTEIILENALNGYGVTVDRQTEFLSLRQHDKHVSAQIKQAEEIYSEEFDFVVGADGAHSPVRKAIGASFIGGEYDSRWSLVDLVMDFPFKHDAGHSFLLPNGHVLAIFPIGHDRYRVIVNADDALAFLPQGCHVKQILWQSQFKLHHRLTDSYQSGHVFLAGDAAHVHAPIGGRGMNLGIDDACVLASMLHDDTWNNYSSVRFPVAKKVIRETDQAYHFLTMQNKLGIFIRNHVLLPLISIPYIQRKQLSSIAGMK